MRGSALPRSAVAGPTSRCKGNTRARKHETVLLYLIGEEIPKRSVSDGRGLNGLSSTRGGRRKALNRSPGSSEPGRRPRSRGRRANETHRTRGPTGRTVGGGSLNGPNQRLSHVPSTSHQRRVLAPRRGDRAPLHDRYMRLSLPQGGWQFRRAVARGHRELETVSLIALGHPTESERRLKTWPRACQVW